MGGGPKVPRNFVPGNFFFFLILGGSSPAQKVWFPWFRGTYRTFWPPPVHVEDPYPTGQYPDQKVWVWGSFFFPELFNSRNARLEERVCDSMGKVLQAENVLYDTTGQYPDQKVWGLGSFFLPDFHPLIEGAGPKKKKLQTSGFRHLGGRKTAQEKKKKTNSWERRFPGTFRTNVPLILPIFSVFSVGGGPKVPRNFVPGNFFFFFLILGGSSPAQKVWFPWLRGTYRTFWPPPVHVEDPYPTGQYPDQKVWVWVLFSSLNFLIPETPAWKSGFVTPWAKCCKLRTYFMTLLDNIRTKKFGFGFFFPPWLSPLNWGGRAQKKKKTANKWF